MVHHFERLLQSINDRLGGGPGEDVDPLTSDWMVDILRLTFERAREMKKAARRNAY